MIHASHMFRAKSRTAFTLVELLVVIAIIGVLIALLIPAVQAARESARRSTCKNNIKQLALAVINYAHTNEAFPGGNDRRLGNSGYSWIVRVLPYIEQADLYDTMGTNSSNWANGPSASVNQTQHRRILPQVVCPSYQGKRNAASGGNPAITDAGVANYKGNSGTAYAEPAISRPYGAYNTTANGPPDKLGGMIQMALEGKYYYSSGPPYNFVVPKMVKDGLSSTIMLSETKEPTYASWMFGNTAFVTAAWGTATNSKGVTTLDSGTTSSVAHVICIKASAQGINNPQQWYNTSAAVRGLGSSSDHTNGSVMHAYGDGHVAEITPEVDDAVMLAIYSRAGKESVEEP